MIPEAELLKSLERCKAAARVLRALPTEVKNGALNLLASELLKNQQQLLAANVRDLNAFDQGSQASNRAFRDRLLLSPDRVALMAKSLKEVAALPDPVGEVVDSETLPNGLKLRRVRSPLGVIFMIFESRPNVATEAFSLAFKSGNVAILRGGKESLNTVNTLYSLIRQSLQAAGADPACMWGIEDPDRAITQFLLAQKDHIDIVVPRGGEGLINFVVENSRIPIIKHDRGMCHVYVHEDADLDMARAIVKNSKAQRPGTCNAMETVLVHRKVAAQLIPPLYKDLEPFNMQWYACPETLQLLSGREHVSPAEEKNWDTEYLDFKMNCRVVGGLDEAISHIERHGSKHSEAIVTKSEVAARDFQEEVDAAAVYWNASTRFTDGFEMGLGGELGISTQKLHVRGPVGLRELTSVRWVVDGTGQIRG